MKSRKNSRHGPTSFINKTFKILNDSKFDSIVSWNEDGNSFIIKNLHSFATIILPQYFKHKNFASFVRQLNMYDFHKVKENSLEFMHPLFQKSNYGLLKEIHRKNTEIQKKNNDIPIIKEESNDLFNRIQRVQIQQVQMRDVLNTLEKEYNVMVEQNQMLVEELAKSKEREQKNENLLNNLKGDNPNAGQISKEDYQEFDEYYYDKLSPL